MEALRLWEQRAGRVLRRRYISRVARAFKTTRWALGRGPRRGGPALRWILVEAKRNNRERERDQTRAKVGTAPLCHAMVFGTLVGENIGN